MNQTCRTMRHPFFLALAMHVAVVAHASRALCAPDVDYVDAGAVGVGNGENWVDAYTNVQYGIPGLGGSGGGLRIDGGQSHHRRLHGERKYRDSRALRNWQRRRHLLRGRCGPQSLPLHAQLEFCRPQPIFWRTTTCVNCAFIGNRAVTEGCAGPECNGALDLPSGYGGGVYTGNATLIGCTQIQFDSVDLDGDGAAGLNDFALFQQAFTSSRP